MKQDIHPDYHPVVFQDAASDFAFLTRSTIAGPDTGARELNLVDPSEGGDLLFEVLSTPLAHTLSGDGAVVSVLRDVTDLKRATTELEHQFKRVRAAELKARRERDRLNLIRLTPAEEEES